MDGVLNVLKPPNMTSNDVVIYTKRLLGIKKIGHAGTLDPQAAGVLPLCIGNATKIADYIMSDRKTYICEVLLGIETDTYDLEGQIVNKTCLYPEINDASNVINSFVGEIHQIPPMYSAIKINGKKMYELARKGEKVSLPPRKVIIYDISILRYTFPNRILFSVTCSKGTYIRSLCKDIGDKLGCGGTMSFLLRSKSGTFTIDDSYTLDEISSFKKNNDIGKILLPIDGVLSSMAKVMVPNVYFDKIINGNIIDADLLNKKLSPDQEVLVYCNNIFVGIGIFINNFDKLYLKMRKVFYRK